MINNILKPAKYLLSFLLLFAIKTSAQNISGIYSGTLVNDSLKMVQNYELALSEYRGKITGYSYITFVTNDTFYYGIKRIKASRQNGELVVEDVEMLANNYPKRPDKGVRVINRIPLPPGQDTILDMNGKWETTATKKFYSISGALTLRRNDDSIQSPLIAHLTELKEINYQDEKKNTKNIAKTEIKQKEEKPKPAEVVYIESRPKENRSSTIETKPIVKETVAVPSNEKPIEVKEQPKREQKPQVITAEAKPKEIQQKENESARVIATEQKITENKPTVSQPKTTTQTDIAVNSTLNSSGQIASTEKRAIEGRPSTTSTANNTTEQNKVAAATTGPKPSLEQPKALGTAITLAKEKEAVQQTVTKQTVSNTQSQSKEIKPPSSTTSVVAPEQPKSSNTVNTESKTAVVDVKNNSAPPVIVERASNTIQTLTVVSDSLVLSFYDNGVVDGDSISVYLNTENIISSVKLKEAAVKKTIYINNRTDDMKLTLVADNLGSIPPNTGLLIIQDGNERYQIRFSADLQTNASVILRKKR
jgi:hypothetical protein